MKTSNMFSALAAILIFTVAVSIDVSASSDSAKVTVPQLKPQTLCPVMKNPIDSSAYTDIQGQRVYHCCQGCERALRKDPNKYFEQAAKEGIVFQNIQKTCPVTDKPINKQVQTYYKGRQLYFCSADCVTKFTASPETYLSKLDKSPKAEAKGTTDRSSHSH